MRKSFIGLMAVALLAISCGPTNKLTRGEQYAKMYEEKPVTLLIMPPINNTSNVEAKDYLYTSISKPLAEAGYYVISPLLAIDILKSESAYDSENFVDAPLTVFKNYFGCDAVVFSEINQWAKKGFGIQRRGLSEKSGKSVPTINRHLAELQEKGLVVHEGSRKTGGYYAK